jgi:uncharacterized protein (DUF4415 family)
MSEKSTRRISKIRITDEIRQAYDARDKSLDNLDPDNPVRPPEFWENAEIGRFYRPIKTQVSFRVDNDVLEWLKSKGGGHLTRINEILRKEMMADRAT